MKNFVKIIVLLFALTTLYSFSFAQEWRWGSWWSSPLQVFEQVVNEANHWNYNIQETALDGVTDLEWTYPRQYKISNTLDYFRQHIDPYIQWAVYIWLIVSTVWLIICGFLMVTGWVTKSSGFDKVKSKIINALLWVFVLSGFYLIIKLIVWIINTFFGENI